MSLLQFEFLFSLLIVIHSLYFTKILYFFIYLTNYTLCVHALIFYQLLKGRAKTDFTKKLFSIGWSVGWVVVVLFWIYVYPLVDISVLPPFWSYISTHGIIHFMVVYEFYRNQIRFESFSLVKWPLVFVLTYLFVVVVPLKFAGKTVYPLFFEEAFATIAIIIGAITMMTLSFYSGYLFKASKVD